MKLYIFGVEEYNELRKVFGGKVIEECFNHRYRRNEFNKTFKNISKYFYGDKFILINGSGYFHHLTLFPTLSIEKDYIYVHIDNHTDAYKDKEINCATFVYHLNLVKDLKYVFLFPTEILSDTESFSKQVFSLLYESPDSVEVFLPEDKDYRTVFKNVFLTKLLHIKKIKNVYSFKEINIKYKFPFFADVCIKWKDVKDINKEIFSGNDVYISIDLDVLKTHPRMYWKGHATMDDLENVLKLIKSGCKEIVAVDVCGYESSNLFGWKKDNMKDLKNVCDIVKNIL